MRSVWRRWLSREMGDGLVLSVLLVLSALIRLPLMSFPGFYNDLGMYIQWGVEAQTHPLQIYSYSATVAVTPANYLPLAVFLYAGLIGVYVHLVHPLPLLTADPNYVLGPYPGLIWFVKLPVLAGDIGLIALLYRLARRLQPRYHVAVAVLSYAISPAVLLSGVLWGQLDNVVTCGVILAWLLVLEEHEMWAGVVLTLAILVKPQPVVFVPLLLIYLWRWRGYTTTLRTVAAMAVTALVTCAVYLVPPHPQLAALYRNMRFWFTKQPQTSVDADNLWTLLGAASHPYNTPYLGPLTTDQVGWGLFAGVLVVVCAGIWLDRRPSQWFLAAGITACAFFTLTTQQHERYLYPALALLLVAAALTDSKSGRLHSYVLYAVVTLTCTLNLTATGVLAPRDPRPFWLFPPPLLSVAHVLATQGSGAIAVMNLLALLAALLVFVRGVAAGRRGSAQPVAEAAAFPPPVAVAPRDACARRYPTQAA